MRDVLGHERGVGFAVGRDAIPPVAWGRAPLAWLSGTFTVQRDAQDSGAGIGGLYDVQYRVDDGAWTDWLTGTIVTSAGFAGESGHVYHFRVRTWDNACANIPSLVEGFVEAWTM